MMSAFPWNEWCCRGVRESLLSGATPWQQHVSLKDSDINRGVFIVFFKIRNLSSLKIWVIQRIGVSLRPKSLTAFLKVSRISHSFKSIDEETNRKNTLLISECQSMFWHSDILWSLRNLWDILNYYARPLFIAHRFHWLHRFFSSSNMICGIWEICETF